MQGRWRCLPRCSPPRCSLERWGLASAQEVGGNRPREVNVEVLVEAPEEGPEEDPKRKSDPIPPLAMPVSDAASLARVPADVIERDGLQLVLDRKHHQLLVLRDGRMTRRYPAAVGTTGWETPAGRFRVFEKVKEPVWTHPVSGELVEAESEKKPVGITLDWLLPRLQWTLWLGRRAIPRYQWLHRGRIPWHPLSLDRWTGRFPWLRAPV